MLDVCPCCCPLQTHQQTGDERLQEFEERRAEHAAALAAAEGELQQVTTQMAGADERRVALDSQRGGAEQQLHWSKSR